MSASRSTGSDITAASTGSPACATVLVESPSGEPFSDGRRYLTFYVPLALLPRMRDRGGIRIGLCLSLGALLSSESPCRERVAPPDFLPLTVAGFPEYCNLERD